MTLHPPDKVREGLAHNGTVGMREGGEEAGRRELATSPSHEPTPQLTSTHSM